MSDAGRGKNGTEAALRDLLKNERLRTIALEIPAGETAADIGTDHGFLPIALVKSGRCPSVILTDVSGPSLEKARSDVRDAFGGTEPSASFDFREGNGLNVLSPGEVGNIVIAGMGGLLIAEILQQDPGKTQSFRRFVLQPRSQAGPMRAALQSAGLALTKEQVVPEGKYFCPVVTAVWPERTVSESLPPYGCDAGADAQYDYPRALLDSADRSVRAFLRQEREKQLRILVRIRSEAARPEAAERPRARLEQIESLLRDLEDIL